MDKADIIRQAIREINPTAKFIIRGETPQTVAIDGVEWNNDTTPIATADIEAKMIEVQAAYDAQAYSRNRLTEYPAIQECIHAILDDDLDALQVLRQAVKDKYPKP